MQGAPSSFPIPYTELCVRDTLLARDSLLFNEEILAKGDSYGMLGHERPITIKGNDVVICYMLLCFILFVFIVRYANRHLKDRVKDYFFPTRSVPKMPANTNWSKGLIKVASVFIVSALASLAYIILTQISDIYLSFNAIHVVIVTSLAVLLFYIYSRVLVCRWVHWVFFTNEQRAEWNKHFSLLILVECLFLFPFSLVLLFASLPMYKVALSAIIVFIFLKILFLFKVKTIFFPSFYGSLYLFMYLCALEGLPLLVLWSTLDTVSHGLISKI